MDRTLLSCITLAGLASMIPTVAKAQCCDRPGPMNCTISQTRSVVTTQLRPQQVTTFCDVTETQVQHRQVVENIPVTTCKNVTVDEGGYQMVWVPKPVTKQVAQTTVRQQVKTVAVPVQVTRRVPQMATQMVPVQSVQYVTEHVPVQAMAMSGPACDSCGNGQAFGAPMFAPQLGFLSQPYQPAPYTSAAVPLMPAITIPTPQTASVPTPIYQPGKVKPESFPARSAPDAYETVPARSVPNPRDEATAPARKPSMFSGVPSAAAVWQTRSASLR